MDSLNDILSRKDFDEPSESLAIKQYVREQFDEAVAVTVRERDIIIAAPSAALANTLRMRILAIQKLVGTQRRLVFRIGK
jgi:hypothetical protein